MAKLVLATLLLLIVTVSHAREKTDLVCLSRFSNILEGREERLTFLLDDTVPLPASVEFRVLIGSRTLSAGQTTVMRDRKFEFGFQTPEIPPGTVLPVTVVGMIADRPESQTSKELFVYPKNPFRDRGEWLVKLKLHLFDPEQRTGKLFESMEIPFKKLDQLSVDSLDSGGILVVGEGFRFDAASEWVDECWKLAQRGHRMICLSPASGSLIWPQEATAPSTLTMARLNYFHRHDKRLDVNDWVGGKSPVSSSLRLEVGQSGSEFRVSQKELGAFCVLDADYQPTRGRLIICGASIVDGWDSTPAPRQFLSYLFETVSLLPKPRPHSRDELREAP